VAGLVDGAEGEDEEDDEREKDKEEEEEEEFEDEDKEEEEAVDDVNPGPDPLRNPCRTVRYHSANFSKAVAARRWSCGCEEQAPHSSVAEIVRVASRLKVSISSRVRSPGLWPMFVVLLVPVLPPLFLVLIEGAPDPDDDRHMSAHVCSALMALAAAVMQGLAGVEQHRRVGASAALLGRVLMLLLTAARGMPLPPRACPASGLGGGVSAAALLAPNPPTSHDSQASRSETEGSPASARKSDSSDAVKPSTNSESPLPSGEVPAVLDGLRLKRGSPWLPLPKVWTRSGYKLHSIVGWHKCSAA
jgi:hypothetical protein